MIKSYNLILSYLTYLITLSPCFYNCVISFTQQYFRPHTSSLLTATKAHKISLRTAAVHVNQKPVLQKDDKQLKTCKNL